MSATATKPETTLLCPSFESAFQILGRRWSGLVLTSLTDGPKRFCQIRDSVQGLSDRMLSIRLTELEAEGMVDRTVDPDSRPVKVVYELTPKGLELRPALVELRSWAMRWMVPQADDA